MIPDTARVAVAAAYAPMAAHLSSRSRSAHGLLYLAAVRSDRRVDSGAPNQR